MGNTVAIESTLCTIVEYNAIQNRALSLIDRVPYFSCLAKTTFLSHTTNMPTFVLKVMTMYIIIWNDDDDE